MKKVKLTHLETFLLINGETVYVLDFLTVNFLQENPVFIPAREQDLSL